MDEYLRRFAAVEMASRRFTTLVATFEPFPSKRLLDMMRALVESGGRVVWSGPPPVLTLEGDKALPFIAWAPVSSERSVPGGAVLQLLIHGSGTIKIPLAGIRVSRLFAEGPTPGSRGEQIPYTIEGGALVFSATDRTSGRWIYATKGG